MGLCDCLCAVVCHVISSTVGIFNIFLVSSYLIKVNALKMNLKMIVWFPFFRYILSTL